MSIVLANQTEGLTSLDEDSFIEEDDVYNFRQLMDAILSAENNEMIFTIAAEDAETLRKGLIKRKSIDNSKLKAAGIPVDAKVLAFLVYPAKDQDEKNPQIVDVRVHLRDRKGVKIMDMRAPSNEL